MATIEELNDLIESIKEDITAAFETIKEKHVLLREAEAELRELD